MKTAQQDQILSRCSQMTSDDLVLALRSESYGYEAALNATVTQG